MELDLSGGPAAVYASLADRGEAALSPAAALLAYAGAFCARDADFISGLLAEAGLVEVPLLRPNRLLGRREIRLGHAAAFESIAVARIDLEPPAERDAHAIAAGTLAVERVDGSKQTHDIGLVSEVRDGRPQRLSLYLNARRVRLWSDRAVL